MIQITDKELKQKLFECYAKKLERHNLEGMYPRYLAYSLSVTIQFENKEYEIHFYADETFYYLLES